jgi:metallopeptidase MepB
LTFTSQLSFFTHAPTVDMAKYANPPQAPPLFTGTKDSIVADSKALCDHTRSLLDSLVATIKPAENPSAATFDSVLRPQTEDENRSSLSARILGFYQYVSGDSALRDASTEAEKIMDEFGIECSMREDVFRLVDAVYNRSGLSESAQKDKDRLIDLALANTAGLDNVESARLLEKERKSYIRNGLGLPEGPKRDRFKEIKKRLSQIQIAFQKNLNEENNGIWFTPEQLDGVPQDVLDTLEKGTGENEGKIRLSFKYPDLFPTLKFAKHPETRRKVFIDNENKVCSLAALSRSRGCENGANVTFTCSATKTPRSSRRLSSSATRPLAFSAIPTTLRSASRRRWPRRRRRCWISSGTSRPVWPRAVSR